MVVKKTPGVVKFFGGKYWYFSNFAATPVAGSPTVEHAYQAAKFRRAPSERRSLKKWWRRWQYRQRILEAPNPAIAKKIANDPEAQELIRPDWFDVRVKIMKAFIWEKVLIDPYIEENLLATGDALIVEDSPRDAFWGRGPDGNGQNMLGKIWMEVRTELRKKREKS